MKGSKFLQRFLALSLLSVMPALAWGEIARVKYQAGGDYLVIEALDDDLIHVEYGKGEGPAATQALSVTPLVQKTDYTGPTSFSDHGDGTLETRDVLLQVNKTKLSIGVVDKSNHGAPLTTLSPLALGTGRQGLEAAYSGELDVYGLGQQFVEAGNPDTDWETRVREGGEFGNVMAGFNNGANGNTQIPVAYLVSGSGSKNHALFLDNTYKQRWDFTGNSKWKAEVFGGTVRFYLMTGNDLPDLRKDYMELVGHPLVPPKKMFGLWVSEYGYDDWAELDGKLNSLRTHKFPVDGFVLDLQWFGGIKDNSENTRMGSLSWDTAKFPNPSQKLADLRDREGVGIMLIEEAYIGKALPEHADLGGRGCLAKRCGSNDPAYIDVNPWWGKGGMIDYSSDSCGDYWHDTKRQPLIRDGVIAHWTDLGEPEMYKSDSCYAGGAHRDVHNLFNFEWLQGIHRGYARNHNLQRPFIMSRSGNAGIQRYGAAMWSGDIAGRLGSLAAHAANQMHMSFSGIDYYGADIGGFHRNLDGDLNEMYTRWFAYAMLFDVPGRPHTLNLCNCQETAPDRIGDANSNLANARLRYALVPYLYSLAHRAYRFGEPVMPPPLYYDQTDPRLRHLGHEKLLGRDLLAAASTRYGETEMDVYLPAGDWFDWYTHQRIHSAAGLTVKAPLFRESLLRLPLYARQGSIIPLQHVDDKTLNALGKRSDGTIREELTAKVFAAAVPTAFTLYEDDGQTIAYQSGEVRETRITQSQQGNQVHIGVEAAQGTYAGAPASRNQVIQLVASLNDRPGAAEQVRLNKQKLTMHATRDAFENTESGWFNDPSTKSIWIKSGITPVSAAQNFTVDLKESQTCTSSFRSIAVPGEGNGWNPADPARSLQCTTGWVWKGRFPLCGESYKFAADGTWTRNWGSNGLQDGPNFPPPATSGLMDITFDEDDPAHPVLALVDPNPALCGVSARFVCENGVTSPGTSVYVVGNIPELGNWNTDRAVKLEPDGPYPTWTKTIGHLPAKASVEWKCIKRAEAGEHPPVIQWQPGPNNTFTTPASGSAGPQKGAF